MSANPAVLSTAQARLQAKLPAIDPTTIAGIIGMILQLLQGCKKPTPTPAEVKQMATDRPILASIAVNNAMRHQGLRPLTPQGRQIHDAVLSLGSEASVEEIANFMAFLPGDDE